MDIRATKALEITGNVLGYIPGVSTIVGAIKAIVYYNRSKGSTGSQAQQQMAKTAEKIDQKLKNVVISHELKQEESVPLEFSERKLYKDLCRESLLQMIPFANFYYAISETHTLLELNGVARELNNNFDKQVEYVSNRYDIEPIKEIKDNKQKDFMSHILIAIENLELKEIYPSRTNIQYKPSIYFAKSVKTDLYSKCFANYKDDPDITTIEALKIAMRSKIDEMKAAEAEAIKKPPKQTKPGLKDPFDRMGEFNADRQHNQAIIESMESELAKLG